MIFVIIFCFTIFIGCVYISIWLQDDFLTDSGLLGTFKYTTIYVLDGAKFLFEGFVFYLYIIDLKNNMYKIMKGFLIVLIAGSITIALFSRIKTTQINSSESKETMVNKENKPIQDSNKIINDSIEQYKNLNKDLKTYIDKLDPKNPDDKWIIIQENNKISKNTQEIEKLRSKLTPEKIVDVKELKTSDVITKNFGNGFGTYFIAIFLTMLSDGVSLFIAYILIFLIVEYFLKKEKLYKISKEKPASNQDNIKIPNNIHSDIISAKNTVFNQNSDVEEIQKETVVKAIDEPIKKDEENPVEIPKEEPKIQASQQVEPENINTIYNNLNKIKSKNNDNEENNNKIELPEPDKKPKKLTLEELGDKMIINGKALKLFRTKKGMNQIMLANILGISERTYIRMENSDAFHPAKEHTRRAFLTLDKEAQKLINSRLIIQVEV